MCTLKFNGDPFNYFHGLMKHFIWCLVRKFLLGLINPVPDLKTAAAIHSQWTQINFGIQVSNIVVCFSYTFLSLFISSSFVYRVEAAIVVVLTWTCMVELSNEENNIGIISVTISAAGVFSMTRCKFSSRVTVACMDLGPLNMIL